jgi:hypothetical protein
VFRIKILMKSSVLRKKVKQIAESRNKRLAFGAWR